MPQYNEILISDSKISDYFQYCVGFDVNAVLYSPLLHICSNLMMHHLLLFSIIILCSFIQSGLGLKGHGEACEDTPSDPDDLCDYWKGLLCLEDDAVWTCGCSNSADMEYNSTVDTCLVLLGGACMFQSPNPDEGRIELDCMGQGRCDYPSEGDPEMYEACRCPYTMSRTEDRRSCLPSMGHSCSTTEECNPHDLLECRRGKCDCPSSDLVHRYDRTARKCATKVGEPCDPGNNGTTSPSCNTEGGVACVPDSYSQTGYACQCLGANLPHWDNGVTCLPGHMEDCDERCGGFRSNLECLQGKCQCARDPDQVWDEGQKICASVEWAPCSLIGIIHEDSSTVLCRTGLECRRRTPHPYGLSGVCQRPINV